MWALHLETIDISDPFEEHWGTVWGGPLSWSTRAWALLSTQTLFLNCNTVAGFVLVLIGTILIHLLRKKKSPSVSILLESGIQPNTHIVQASNLGILVSQMWNVGAGDQNDGRQNNLESKKPLLIPNLYNGSFTVSQNLVRKILNVIDVGFAFRQGHKLAGASLKNASECTDHRFSPSKCVGSIQNLPIWTFLRKFVSFDIFK